MSEEKIINARVVSEQLLPTPEEVKQKHPANSGAIETVLSARETLRNILDRRDPRLFVVVGPCSVHDLNAAKEYASRLRELSEKVKKNLFLVMRVYFEKPRTSVGWKGFINDPFLNDSFQIDQGLKLSRNFLLELAEMGLPVGTEALDPITPQYLDDCLAWYAIGARTTESQKHREMASGLSAPVGFKNGTDGGIEVALNAIRSAASGHHFLGITAKGQCCIFETAGNPYTHIVLRGGASGPNYDADSIAACEEGLRTFGHPPNIMVDCSHGNSRKNPKNQRLVVESCARQIISGNQSIVGLMIESHLQGGQQALEDDISKLKYGVSITDGCLGWEETAEMLEDLNRQVEGSLSHRAVS